jgi:hypothetical protein
MPGIVSMDPMQKRRRYPEAVRRMLCVDPPVGRSSAFFARWAQQFPTVLAELASAQMDLPPFQIAGRSGVQKIPAP